MVGRAATAPARERLLGAAEELFYARGIAATGVDAILQRAGVAPATLYAHFAGKNALVAAYLQRRHERWRDLWDDVLADRKDPRERAVSVFDALERLHTATSAPRGCAFLGAAVEISDPEHPAYRWLQADTELLTNRLATLAEEAGAKEPGALAAELSLLYDGALAARTRARTNPSRRANDPAPVRDLAAAAVARHCL